MSASVGHSRMVLLQAAAALMAGLAQQPKSRQQLLQPDVSQGLIALALQVSGWVAAGAGDVLLRHTTVCPQHPCANQGRGCAVIVQCMTAAPAPTFKW